MGAIGKRAPDALRKRSFLRDCDSAGKHVLSALPQQHSVLRAGWAHMTYERPRQLSRRVCALGCAADHLWWPNPNTPFMSSHPNKAAPRCLPCHFDTSQFNTSEMPFPAPKG